MKTLPPFLTEMSARHLHAQLSALEIVALPDCVVQAVLWLPTPRQGIRPG